MEKRANRIIKRGFDVVVSSLMLLFLSPIMLAVALGVFISLGRPIFFRQERLGRLGKPFLMLKFRSMRPGNADGLEWSTGINPRKTRFGNFIRRYSLDELAQLINVLRGDMSLVGPRPEAAQFAERFKREIPLYEKRFSAKPGITGLAQIRGLRGDCSIEARAAADVEYIERWSLLLDIKILLKTPFKILNKSEVYSEGQGDE